MKLTEDDFYCDICVAGKVIYTKPMTQPDGYFGGTIGIESISKRPNSAGRKTLVKGFLPMKYWEYLQKQGIKSYDYIALGGQVEEWIDKKGNSKTVHVFDSLIDFKSA